MVYLVVTVRTYDIAPDGQRFAMVKEDAATNDSAAPAVRIRVVLNWFSDLQARVPTGR